jgi:hypothetical protein
MKKRKGRRKPATPPDAGPQRGAAEPGVPVRPTDLPEENSEQATPDRPRAAPPPGVPMTIEEYERLKREAETAPPADEAPAQEDRVRRRED